MALAKRGWFAGPHFLPCKRGHHDLGVVFNKVERKANLVIIHLPLLRSPGKYQEADYADSFVSIFCAGRDCLGDIELLRGDEYGLSKCTVSLPQVLGIETFSESSVISLKTRYNPVKMRNQILKSGMQGCLLRVDHLVILTCELLPGNLHSYAKHHL